MIRIAFFPLVMLCALGVTSAQSTGSRCTCRTTAQWVLSTFESNDAGYRNLIESGDTARLQSARAAVLALEDETSMDVCGETIEAYLASVRRGHFALEDLSPPEESQDGEDENAAEEAIRRRYQDAERMQPTSTRLADSALLSGVYAFADYRVDVVLTSVEPATYVGVVLSADSVYWTPGQVKFRLTDAGNGTFAADFRRRDHSTSDRRLARQLDPRRLWVGGVVWEREGDTTKYRYDRAVTQQLQSLTGDLPSIYNYDEETVVVRLPSMEDGFVPYVDSLVATHRSDLAHTRYLIVDVRGNGGGSDMTYYPLLPYVLTEPLVVQKEFAFELLNTPTTRQWYVDALANGTFGEAFDDFLRSRLTLLPEPADGRFVDISEELQSELRPAPIEGPSPQRVGVLLDGEVGSSAEQFALDARQSWKVKLFGESTYGALDISNLVYADDPCGRYRLYYATSRTTRSAVVPIDGVGVQPDVAMDVSSDPFTAIERVLARLRE